MESHNRQKNSPVFLTKEQKQEYKCLYIEQEKDRLCVKYLKENPVSESDVKAAYDKLIEQLQLSGEEDGSLPAFEEIQASLLENLQQLKMAEFRESLETMEIEVDVEALLAPKN